MRRIQRLLLLLLALLPTTVHAQVTPTLLGFYDVNIDGNNTTYMQGATHRYVNGELRFLSLALAGRLLEFRTPAAYGQRATQVTASWDLGPTKALNNFNGIWWEASKNRLWITSAEDYTNVNHPAKVTLISLGAGGVATVLKQFFLNVPAKRVYGGCQAVPPSLSAQLGGPYVCGWGGYTSLVAQGGGASIGPTMYVIPDPDTIAAGATASVRTILDFATTRGVRTTIPVNYFDGGDPRQNPSTRPTVPPVSSGAWLSPNSQGLGWMTWGDSYYNTGAWVGETFVAVASLCGVQGATTTKVGTTTITGSGACWYQSSTLAFDGRQFELHAWAGSGLGSNTLKRPDQMTVLSIPTPNTRVWSGNIPTGNIGGATFDPTTGIYWLLGFPFNGDYDGRLYAFRVTAGVPPPPPPAPVDAIVSEWSTWTAGAWSTCSAGTQTTTETRTRTVLQPAQNGGTTPHLSESRPASRSCTVTPTPVDATYGPFELVPPPGAWSACVSGTQTRTETWRRPELTPAQNGGVSIPEAERTETRTSSQACTVTQPPPTDLTHVDLKGVLDQLGAAIARVEAALAVQTVEAYSATITSSIRAYYANGDGRLIVRVPAASLPTLPAVGSTITIVRE
jgi:hypothetical protein